MSLMSTRWSLLKLEQLQMNAKPQFSLEILLYLAMNDGRTSLTSLYDNVGGSPSAKFKHLDLLVETRRVTKFVFNGDKRNFSIALTDKGWREINAHMASFKTMLDNHCSGGLLSY